MPSNIAIELQSVSKKYPLVKHMPKAVMSDFEDFWALKGVSLDVPAGEILGVIGRNGAGKTTLLNIISGVLSPTRGRAAVNGRAIGLFNLGTGFQDELTGRENIFLNGALSGATKDELKSKISRIIEFSELGDFIDMPLGTYSQGMRLRLGFSIIVNLDFDILIIDEVLAVGDGLFQNKCFERLMDFKRAGKTLIITTQSMELIERLCGRVGLLDHGELLFLGNAVEGINKYRGLLNTEKFFVGPGKNEPEMVANTKKWVDDPSDFGRKLGTKEIRIDSVKFTDKFGFKCRSLKSGGALSVKVDFTVRNNVPEAHFGVAVFRSDGVYCYGPNTKFDGLRISGLKPGKGRFILKFPRFMLAPGEYLVSVAIWDKNETLAFDHHQGCYKLSVRGPGNPEKELLRIPFKAHPRESAKVEIGPGALTGDQLNDNEAATGKTIWSARLLNSLNEEKDVFTATEAVKLDIRVSRAAGWDKKYLLWAAIHRDDGVYCQGFTFSLGQNERFEIIFPALSLLPGGYRVSLGVWDILAHKFIAYGKDVYPFRTVFKRQDHGTVYLNHDWAWRFD
jgi:lipopolysaccharide transport system ATP-binding protein